MASEWILAICLGLWWILAGAFAYWGVCRSFKGVDTEGTKEAEK